MDLQGPVKYDDGEMGQHLPVPKPPSRGRSVLSLLGLLVFVFAAREQTALGATVG